MSTPPTTKPEEEIQRQPVVVRRTGLSTITLWRLEKQGAFPRRRKLTNATVGWLKSEIDEWISTRQPVDLADDGDA